MPFIVTLCANVHYKCEPPLLPLIGSGNVCCTCSFLFVLVCRKAWLSKVGSPSSRIDRADFANEKSISKLDYSNFSIHY